MLLVKTLIMTAGNLAQIPTATGLAAFSIGYFEQVMADSDHTIPAADAMNGIIKISGSVTDVRTVTIDRDPVEGAFYIIDVNDVSGNFVQVKFRTGGPQLLFPGANCILYGDGSTSQQIPLAPV